MGIFLEQLLPALDGQGPLKEGAMTLSLARENIIRDLGELLPKPLKVMQGAMSCAELECGSGGEKTSLGGEISPGIFVEVALEVAKGLSVL